MQNLSSKLFISRREAAKQLGLSIPTLERRIDDGTIPHIRIGRRILIPADILSSLAQKAYQAGGEK